MMSGAMETQLFQMPAKRHHRFPYQLLWREIQ